MHNNPFRQVVLVHPLVNFEKIETVLIRRRIWCFLNKLTQLQFPYRKKFSK
jgi:hypothetical protein